jgi:hypothetical protein
MLRIIITIGRGIKGIEIESAVISLIIEISKTIREIQ